MNESTRRNASGRFQAAVNAQMPPEEDPPIARRFGSGLIADVFATSGSSSSIRKRA